MLDKLGGIFVRLSLLRPTPQRRLCVQAPKPSCGPHPQRDCLPLIILLRNRLKWRTAPLAPGEIEWPLWR